MTFSSIVFLSLFFLFQQCLAVAVRLQQRDSTYDVASTLVVTATAGDQAVVTFYPSRISDPAFWTLSTPTTTISPSSTRVIGPLGYEWVALPSVVSPPAIPIDAPYPIPGNITTTFFQSPSGSDLLPSATEISISAPLKTITRGNTPQLSNASHETRGSAIFTGTTPATSLSNSIPFKTVVSSIPILSSARSNGEVFSSIGSFSSSNDFGGVSSINFSLTPASSNSFPLPTDDKPSSVPLSSGAGSTRSIPWFTGSNSNSILPPTSLGSTRSIPLGTGRSSIPLSSLGSAPQTIPQETDASSSRVFSQPVISSNSNRPGTGTSSGSIFSPTGIPSTSVRLGTGVTSPTPLSHLTASTTLSDASPSTAVSTDTSVSNGVSSASVGYSSAPVSGAFSATPTEPTQAFPSYEAPTGVVTGVAATSEAAQLSGLFFAIYANRDHITDSNLKQHYIDSVRKTKEETDALFNALDVKPEADPACLNTKRRRHIISERKLRLLIRKRSLISGITDLVGDAAKLLSCATKVVDNLVKAVEAPVPPISEIEVLTDTLNDIGEDLKKEDESPSNSPSATQPSATQETTTQESTASSTASSCKVSSAIPRCTETVTLSTSFISGTPTVQALTTEVCTTITACGESASTVFTTVSTGTSTGGIVCATSCVECANPVVKRSGPLYERSLDDPNDFDSNNQYVLEQIEQFQGVEELEHKQSGRLSSAIIRPFEKTPRRLYVAGLFGCTSVVIISEVGVWFSHHWEAPSFEADDETFDRQVLSVIRDGDPEDPVRMPGPYQFAQGDTVNPLSGDGLLNPKFNVQIFISTPKDPDTGEEIFRTRVDQIVDLLVGEGRPWVGVEPTRRGYLKPTSEAQQRQFQLRANSKVLIEYDNDQEAPFGEEPYSKQQAIYRVWLEQQSYTHRWDAIDNLQIGAACSNPNQKRQDDGSCTRPAASSGASGASTAAAGSASGTKPAATGSLSSQTTASPKSESIPSSSADNLPSSNNIPSSTTESPASNTASSTTTPLGSESASCSPTSDNAPSLPSGDIIGKVEPFCDDIDGKKISAADFNYNDTSSWSGAEQAIFGLGLTINWKDDCFGYATIQSEECKHAFQKIVDDCEPKSAPEGWLLQKFGGRIMSSACVIYGVEIIHGNVFDPAEPPIPPPDVSLPPLPTTTTAKATPPPPTTTLSAPNHPNDPPPDLSSEVCKECMSTLGASDCSADNLQCLVDQCKNDKDCQVCRMDCDYYGTIGTRA